MKIYNLKDRLEFFDEIIILEYKEWGKDINDKDLSKKFLIREKR